jgi:hypothetical protein
MKEGSMNSGATTSNFSRRIARQRPRAPIVEQALDAARLTHLPVSLGTHKFFKALPAKDAIRQVHDNLDLFHAVEVFVKNFSTVYLSRLREIERNRLGPEVEKPRIFVNTAASAFRFPRTSRYTAWSFIDIERSGPIIIEMPPGMLGIVRDLWFRVVEDIGFAETQGEGAMKYVVLPPSYKGYVPRHHSAMRVKTNCASIFMRPVVARSGSPSVKPGALKIYPWSTMDDDLQIARLTDSPPQPLGEIVPEDENFYRDLDRLVQEQPFNSLDKSRRALLASIGIVKGRPFCPGTSMSSILAKGAAIGGAAVRAMQN